MDISDQLHIVPNNHSLSSNILSMVVIEMNNSLSYYNSQFICVYVQNLTPLKPMKGSSRNFQELIRAPHCNSLRKFHPDWVAMDAFLSIDVVWRQGTPNLYLKYGMFIDCIMFVLINEFSVNYPYMSHKEN